MFNAQEITTVASVAVGTLVTISSLWKKVESADPKLVQELPKKAVEVADDVAKFIEKIAASPFFAGKVAAGKLEVQHVLSKLTDSELSVSVAKALAAFGKEWASMSEIEKGTLVTVVQTDMKKLGVSVSVADITKAVTSISSAISSIVPLAKDAADKADAIQAAAKPVEQPAQA